MIAFGDGVVPGEAPHAGDRLGPLLEGMAQAGELLEAAALELLEHCVEGLGVTAALLGCLMLLA